MATCTNCSSENVPGASYCRTCGTPLAAPYVTTPLQPPQTTDSWTSPPYGPVLQPPFYHPAGSPLVTHAQNRAKKALAAALVGMFCCGLLGIPAFVLGNSARVTLIEHGVTEGRGMATAAMILGVVDVVLMAFWILVRIATH